MKNHFSAKIMAPLANIILNCHLYYIFKFIINQCYILQIIGSSAESIFSILGICLSMATPNIPGPE